MYFILNEAQTIFTPVAWMNHPLSKVWNGSKLRNQKGLGTRELIHVENGINPLSRLQTRKHARWTRIERW